MKGSNQPVDARSCVCQALGENGQHNPLGRRGSWRAIVCRVGLYAIAAAGVLAFGSASGAEPTFKDPAYAVAAGRAGNWTIVPRLGLGIEGNDNVFAAASDASSDRLFTFNPSLRMDSSWKRHALGWNLEYVGGRYGKTLSDNYDDFRASALGRLDIGAAGALSLSGGVESQHEPRESAESAPDSALAIDEKRTLDVTYRQQLGRNFIVVGAKNEQHDYSDSQIDGVSVNQDDRDRTLSRITLDAGRTRGVDSNIYLRVASEQTEYDEAADDAGYQRDTDAFMYGIGVTRQASAILKFDAFVGNERRTYTDPRFPTVSTLIHELRLAWALTPLTTLRADLARSVLDTSLFGAASLDSQRAGFAIDHELLRNLILSAGYARIADTYRENTRRDAIGILSLEADYAMNRNLYLSLDLVETQRETSGATEDADYRQRRIGMGVKLNY